MPRPICPKCYGENVKAIELRRKASTQEPPQLLWACLSTTCLYHWPRNSEAQAAELQVKWKQQGALPCAHSVQHLATLARHDAGSMMGTYYCAECGKKMLRLYDPYGTRSRSS